MHHSQSIEGGVFEVRKAIRRSVPAACSSERAHSDISMLMRYGFQESGFISRVVAVHHGLFRPLTEYGVIMVTVRILVGT